MTIAPVVVSARVAAPPDRAFSLFARDMGRWWPHGEPPVRLLLGWQLNSRFAYDPDFLTEVELTFAPDGAGGSTVTLEHRNLERFGADAEKVGGGWPRIIGNFVDFAGAPSAV